MRRNKKTKLFVGGVVVSAAMALAGCTAGVNDGRESSAGGSQTFSLPHVFPENSAVHKAAVEFQEKAPEVTDGRVNFEVYSNGQMGGDEEIGANLSNGDLECAFFAAAPSGLDPKLQLSFLPYIATDYDEADALYHDSDGVIQTNDREVLAEHGITMLGFYENDFRGLTNSHGPVTSPEDLEGLTLRVPGMPMYIDMFEEWGANPVAVPFPELYTAMQQGTVDGQDNGVVLSYNGGFDEVQDYLTLTRHGYGTGHLACNTDIWESLSQEDRDALTELAGNVSAQATENVRESVEELTDEMVADGMQVTELSPEELAEFVEIRETVWEANADVFGDDTIAALRDEVEAVESE